MKRSFVVLISGRGSNLQALIEAVQRGEINAFIAAVISNRGDAHGLRLAREAGLATHVVEAVAGEDKPAYDARLIGLIDGYQPDLVVLAGFMRILSGDFISHYSDRILNIHPSLLPRHKGLHTHRRVLEAGDAVHGASVHVVNNELDSGAVVVQAEVPVMQNDTETTLAARVLEQEHVIYPLALGWFFDGRLGIDNGIPRLDGRILKEPIVWTTAPEPAI